MAPKTIIDDVARTIHSHLANGNTKSLLGPDVSWHAFLPVAHAVVELIGAETASKETPTLNGLVALCDKGATPSYEGESSSREWLDAAPTGNEKLDEIEPAQEGPTDMRLSEMRQELILRIVARGEEQPKIVMESVVECESLLGRLKRNFWDAIHTGVLPQLKEIMELMKPASAEYESLAHTHMLMEKVTKDVAQTVASTIDALATDSNRYAAESLGEDYRQLIKEAFNS